MKLRNFIKQPAILIVSLALVLAISVGTTLALIFDETDEVVNTFTPANVGTEVDETIDSGVKKDVKVQNTGDTAAYIRATVVINWQNAAGQVYPGVPTAPTDYAIDWELDGWVLGADGYYYYTQAVPADDKATDTNEGLTGVLFTDCSPVADQTPDDYFLTVEIIAEAIQATPDSAVSVWSNDKVTVSGNNGTLSVIAN